VLVAAELIVLLTLISPTLPFIDDETLLPALRVELDWPPLLDFLM
jgi:hypothetical protein